MFRVGKHRARLLLCCWRPGFQTNVIALATLWAPSVKKWSLYENGKKNCG